jgi:hypothetical protein
MSRNLVGSIYGKSSIAYAHFVPIHLQTWLPQAILVSDWLISKKSVSKEKNLKNQPIRNKSPVVAMFVIGSGRIEQSLQSP